MKTRFASLSDVMAICRLHPEGLAARELLDLCEHHRMTKGDGACRRALKKGLLALNSDIHLVVPES